MGRSPCCSKEGLNRGPWTAMEDKTLTDFIKIHGEGKWRSVPKNAGLKRCGKSCRLRWLNYLRPDIKRGNITDDEEDLIIRLHNLLGNRWSLIAGRLPGRTDNEIKNYWNTNISKKLNIKGGGGRVGQPQSSTTSSAGNCLIRRNSSVKKPLSLRQQPHASDSCAVRTKASRCTRVSIPSEPQADNRRVVGPSLHEDLSVNNTILVGKDIQLISKEDDPNDFIMDFNLDDDFLSEFLKSEADPFCGFDSGVKRRDTETRTNHETGLSSDETVFSSDDMLHDLDQLGSMASLLDPDMDWLQN